MGITEGGANVSETPKGETQILIRCGDCSGTGLYRDVDWPEGVAVVCQTCGGSGGRVFKYTPFKGIVTRTDIKRVYRKPGRHPTGPSISYRKFVEGKTP
jgi:hypothetical protein